MSFYKQEYSQDIIHFSRNSFIKLPTKHIGLALCVHHLTSWCLIVTLLNKIGHCCIYDKFCATNTRITADVLPKVDKYGSVVPLNVLSGPFLQLAADNTDNNEETLTRKNTTHAASMVVFQRQPNGPETHPQSTWQTTIWQEMISTSRGKNLWATRVFCIWKTISNHCFIQVRLNKSGFKKIMTCLSQHVVLIKYGKSWECIPQV